MSPTQEVFRAGGCKTLKFSSDDEMIEYYREAILEAIVYCMSNGFSEEYVVSLDVYGFGEIYKYLKRIEARKQLKHLNNTSMAFGGNKKQRKEYVGFIEMWLPAVESENSGSRGNKGSNSVAEGQAGFAAKCRKGF